MKFLLTTSLLLTAFIISVCDNSNDFSSNEIDPEIIGPWLLIYNEIEYPDTTFINYVDTVTSKRIREFREDGKFFYYALYHDSYENVMIEREYETIDNTIIIDNSDYYPYYFKGDTLCYTTSLGIDSLATITLLRRNFAYLESLLQFFE